MIYPGSKLHFTHWVNLGQSVISTRGSPWFWCMVSHHCTMCTLYSTIPHDTPVSCKLCDIMYDNTTHSTHLFLNKKCIDKLCTTNMRHKMAYHRIDNGVYFCSLHNYSYTKCHQQSGNQVLSYRDHWSGICS